MLRKLLFLLMPDRAADIEAESREWMLQCQRCGYEVSVWDSGGIRYKARGKPRRYGKCRNCQQRSWLTLYRKQNEQR